MGRPKTSPDFSPEFLKKVIEEMAKNESNLIEGNYLKKVIFEMAVKEGYNPPAKSWYTSGFNGLYKILKETYKVSHKSMKPIEKNNPHLMATYYSLPDELHYELSCNRMIELEEAEQRQKEAEEAKEKAANEKAAKEMALKFAEEAKKKEVETSLEDKYSAFGGCNKVLEELAVILGESKKFRSGSFLFIPIRVLSMDHKNLKGLFETIGILGVRLSISIQNKTTSVKLENLPPKFNETLQGAINEITEYLNKIAQKENELKLQQQAEKAEKAEAKKAEKAAVEAAKAAERAEKKAAVEAAKAAEKKAAEKAAILEEKAENTPKVLNNIEELSLVFEKVFEAFDSKSPNEVLIPLFWETVAMCDLNKLNHIIGDCRFAIQRNGDDGFQIIYLVGYKGHRKVVWEAISILRARVKKLLQEKTGEIPVVPVKPKRLRKPNKPIVTSTFVSIQKPVVEEPISNSKKLDIEKISPEKKSHLRRLLAARLNNPNGNVFIKTVTLEESGKINVSLDVNNEEFLDEIIKLMIPDTRKTLIDSIFTKC